MAATLLQLARAGERVHLVGVGGAGMSGLALLLQARGAVVTGSDRQAGPALDDLTRRGITVHVGHDPEHAAGCAALVYSAAIPSDHPELETARSTGARLLKRAEALAEMVNQGRVVGVAGTHGKTTTTALLAAALEDMGTDPTALVGGRLADWGGNARIGGGDLFVVEADEYDRSFLTLEPDVAVVTSVESEHLDTYGSVEEMEDAFALFCSKVPEGGRVVACSDDPGAARCLLSAGARGLAYGTGPDADLQAESVAVEPGGTRFSARYGGDALGEFELALHGRHNVLNALGALGAILALGFDPVDAASALSGFGGVDRRFQTVGEAHGVLVLDDYAHHPTEVAATLEAARGAHPDRRLVVIFQPHLYTRTREFADRFGEALAPADLVLVAPIYPAREQPISGVDAGLVAEAVAKRAGKGTVITPGSLEAAVEAALAGVRSGDVLLTMGAGDVDRAGRLVLERLRRRSHVDA